MSFTTDTTKFAQSLLAIGEKQRALALEAAVQFAHGTIGDAQEITPKKTGDLAASGYVGEADVNGNRIVIPLGFNKYYAAAVHERLTNAKSGKVIFHEPPTSAKFLEITMRKNEAKFPEFVGNYVKAGMNG